MSKFFYFHTSSFIFLIAGLLHLYRVVNGVNLYIGQYLVPAWASIVAGLMACVMAYFGYRFSK